MFQEVLPEDIPEVWGLLEPGLSEIKRRCEAPWVPAQVRTHLIEGRATAFLSSFGFLILERCKEPLTADPYLNVWLMWSRPREAFRRREEIVLFLDGMKKRAKCLYWQFGSPREEWAEVIKPYCDKVLTIWRRK